MARIKLRFVNAVRDRYGSIRYYFRRPGFKNVRLPGLPGSAEFMEAYQAALAGESIGADRVGKGIIPGTVAATVRSYLGSAAFHELAPETRRVRRHSLEKFAEEHGDKRIAGLQRTGVQNLIDAKRSTPGTARNLLSSLSVLMRFAIESGLRADNPAAGVKRPRLRPQGWHAWTEEDIEAFQAKHPIGSRARLALALLLYTGQRRSDVVRMGRQHVRNGVIEVRQQKTGAVLAIPIHPELQAALDATPSQHLTFLTTHEGKPFTPGGFTHYFRLRCREAELPKGCSAHGLRKAACRRLAEAGCSANVIASISGHASLREVERYTKEADQVRMARTAIEAITTGTSVYKHKDQFVKKSEKA